MPGVPLDAMDKLKSIFKRKKTPGTSTTAGTKTETPENAAVPKPTTTDTAAAPSTSEPTAPPAGAAPVEAPKDTAAAPAEEPPAPAPAAAPTDPTPEAGEAQKSEAAAVAAT